MTSPGIHAEEYSKHEDGRFFGDLLEDGMLLPGLPWLELEKRTVGLVAADGRFSGIGLCGCDRVECPEVDSRDQN